MRFGALLFFALLLAGCASGSDRFWDKLFYGGYRPPPNAKVVLGRVRDLTSSYPYADETARIERVRGLLSAALRFAGLLWEGEGYPLVLDVDIVEYAPREDFTLFLPARTLSELNTEAVLGIHARLKDHGRTVGLVFARRRVLRIDVGDWPKVGALQRAHMGVAAELIKKLKAKLYYDD